MAIDYTTDAQALAKMLLELPKEASVECNMVGNLLVTIDGTPAGWIEVRRWGPTYNEIEQDNSDE